MVPSGPRRWHIQEPRGIEEALRGQGHHRQQGDCHLLPHRREIFVHMVRAKVSPRLPKRAKLRRFMDRMGKPRSESYREAEPIDSTSRSSIKYRINLSLSFLPHYFKHLSHCSSVTMKWKRFPSCSQSTNTQPCWPVTAPSPRRTLDHP